MPAARAAWRRTLRASDVSSTVRMLHSLGLQVYAEGVANADDAARLWKCKVDGITGPVVM